VQGLRPIRLFRWQAKLDHLKMKQELNQWIHVYVGLACGAIQSLACVCCYCQNSTKALGDRTALEYPLYWLALWALARISGMSRWGRLCFFCHSSLLARRRKKGTKAPRRRPFGRDPAPTN
jgi:hypothetical protein